MPNKSLQATLDGEGHSAVAVHIPGSACLSSGRLSETYRVHPRVGYCRFDVQIFRFPAAHVCPFGTKFREFLNGISPDISHQE
jgi:hypothetical protein